MGYESSATITQLDKQVPYVVRIYTDDLKIYTVLVRVDLE